MFHICPNIRSSILGGLLALILAAALIPLPGIGQVFASAGSPALTIHVVAWGDSVRSITQQYGVTAESLFAANPFVVPEHLYAGQQLIIPGTVPQTAPDQEAAPADTIYVVRPGDTLSEISQHFGVPMSWIIVANRLINPSRIYAGQSLIIPSSQPTPAQGTTLLHVVQRGETLSRIARAYNVPMTALIQANNISNPSLLYVGQVLTITSSPANSTAGTGSPSTPPGVPTTYTIQRGDTLGEIAQRFGISVGDLMIANHILNRNRIYAGESLIIPVPGSTPADQSAPDYAPTPTVVVGKQIIVVLSQQRVYAFEDGQFVREFLVSTGLPATPTVTGSFEIYLKLATDRMVGPDYDLPNVPWVMYFYRDYSLHGTYWHNNFGQPMSHGCVNMRTPDAEWLFYWAPLGTPVLVIR